MASDRVEGSSWRRASVEVSDANSLSVDNRSVEPKFPGCTTLPEAGNYGLGNALPIYYRGVGVNRFKEVGVKA